MGKVYMPDGTEVEQGGPEDQATWKTCFVCEHTGPHVGTDKQGRNACMGSCGGIRPNPDIPRATLRKDPTTCPHDNVFAHVSVIKFGRAARAHRRRDHRAREGKLMRIRFDDGPWVTTTHESLDELMNDLALQGFEYEKLGFYPEEPGIIGFSLDNLESVDINPYEGSLRVREA